jgi:hypothetical protein
LNFEPLILCGRRIQEAIKGARMMQGDNQGGNEDARRVQGGCKEGARRVQGGCKEEARRKARRKAGKGQGDAESI